MNYGLSQRALLTVGKDMSHDVVTDFFFFFNSNIKVYVINIRLEFVDHSFSNRRQSEFMLSFGKRNPAFSPVGKFKAFAKEFLHGFAGVARNKWLLINVSIHGDPVVY